MNTFDFVFVAALSVYGMVASVGADNELAALAFCGLGYVGNACYWHARRLERDAP